MNLKSIKYISKAVTACCCLHNMAINNHEDWIDYESPSELLDINDQVVYTPFRRIESGVQKREELAER